MKNMLQTLFISTACFFCSMAYADVLTVTSSVYTSNCEVAFFQDGSPVTIVNIGNATLNAGEKGPEIYITMKPTDTYERNCLAHSARPADLAWAGNLGSKGILPQSGNAVGSGAYIEFRALNAQSTLTITSNRPSVKFDPDLLLTDGYQFKLQLIGGKKAGTFYSAIAWAVSWV